MVLEISSKDHNREFLGRSVHIKHTLLYVFSDKLDFIPFQHLHLFSVTYTKKYIITF